MPIVQACRFRSLLIFFIGQKPVLLEMEFTLDESAEEATP